MTAASPLQARLAPAELFRDARYGRSHFVSIYGDSLLLLVRLAPGQTDLENGLLVGDSEQKLESIRPGALQFRTELHSLADAPLSSRAVDVSALQTRLSAGRHFMVPLRKREHSETLSEARITIGRAYNQDVVLRHSSVSKFHAWIEAEPDGGLRVADAGSSNGTRLNEALLDARVRTPVQAGDVLRFGAVSCLVCDAEGMFAVLSAA